MDFFLTTSYFKPFCLLKSAKNSMQSIKEWPIIVNRVVEVEKYLLFLRLVLAILCAVLIRACNLMNYLGSWYCSKEVRFKEVF